VFARFERSKNKCLTVRCAAQADFLDGGNWREMGRTDGFYEEFSNFF